ncbi:hypothetical protein KKB43_03660 [Patescibacteria group bacterium]|nr:hypothetical protein [Patescibacteria group bacterium]MBU4580088.1 hypothetical protein [Patescibacteria group bacterium]
MNYQTKITGQSIVLPKKWIGKKVFIRETDDTIIVKKMQEPSLKNLRPGLLKLGKMISKKDIQDAVVWARNKSK